MIASVLQCEYIKHGMTCELAAGGLRDATLIVVLICFCSLIVIVATGGRR